MPLIIGAKSTAAEAYTVDNSCRFNAGDSPKLAVTNGTATDNQKWTCSFWIKRGVIEGSHCLMGAKSGSPYFYLYIDDVYRINFYGPDKDGSNDVAYVTNRLFRDPSAWYHIVAAMDSTLATAGDRFRIYVNGVEETSFSTETDPTQNKIYPMNYTGFAVNVASRDDDVNPYDGYMAEVCLIDGQQLTPSSFGEFDEDSPTIWKPKDVSGLTFGNNGFYLDFEDSADLGADASGNSNDLTETNLDATDQATDTPANNFCTINSIVGLQGNSSDTVFSQGNTTVVGTGPASNEWRAYYGTMGVSSGKWYWEVECTNSWGADSAICQRHGICDVNQLVQQEDESSTDLSRAWGWRNPGGYRNNNSDTDDSSYDGYTNGDILQFALDLDNNKLYFGKDGTWEDSGDPTSGATGTGAVSITAGYTYTPLDERLYGSDKYSANFGNPGFTVSSGNADGNGYGNFEYAVPSGYYALCTKNLGAYGG